MPEIKSISIAPVKSLGLVSKEAVRVGCVGVEEDRRFLVCDAAGAMVTQRQIGRLALVKSEYCTSTDQLKLEFPDGSSVAGVPELGIAIETKVFRRMVSGSVVKGELSEALSEYCGTQLALVKTEVAGVCQDAYPVSLLSQASIDYLSEVAQNGIMLEHRRFRPNFLLVGCEAHEEDSWLGREVAVGEEVRLRVEMLDPRCAMTTLNPNTGERDMDTPRVILGYRGDVNGNGACFGVYGTVVSSGVVKVGDEVRVAE